MLKKRIFFAVTTIAHSSMFAAFVGTARCVFERFLLHWFNDFTSFGNRFECVLQLKAQNSRTKRAILSTPLAGSAAACLWPEKQKNNNATFQFSHGQKQQPEPNAQNMHSSVQMNRKIRGKKMHIHTHPKCERRTEYTIRAD